MQLLVALLANSLVQEQAAAAKKLLDAVVDKMKDSETISFEAEQSLGTNAQGKTKCYLKRPDKGRFDWGSQVVLFDGMTQWTYSARSKTHSRNAFKGVPPYKGYGPVYDLFFLKTSDPFLTDDKGAVSVKKEKVGTAEFEVVTWKGKDGDTRLWIDKDKLIYRYDETWLADGKPLLVTVAFGGWDLSLKLAADFFTFTPPKDAKKE
jgi:outer membrane lipoprotein-sorting protein